MWELFSKREFLRDLINLIRITEQNLGQTEIINLIHIIDQILGQIENEKGL